MSIPAIIKSKKRPFPLESVIEDRLRKKIKAKGGKFFKFSSINNRGVFDRICLWQGTCVFVEVKAEKGKPSRKQAVFARDLEDNGQYWCYVYGEKGSEEFLHDLFNHNAFQQVYHAPKRRKPIPHIIEK